MNIANNLIRRLVDKLSEYDEADPYHDCSELIHEAKSYLESKLELERNRLSRYGGRSHDNG